MIETKFDKCKKRNYRSRKEAKEQLKKINRHKKNDLLKSVYICPVCESWHITSMEKKQSRNITRNLKNNTI